MCNNSTACVASITRQFCVSICCRVICYDTYCAQVEGEEGFVFRFSFLVPIHPFQVKQMGQPFVLAENFDLPHLKGM